MLITSKLATLNELKNVYSIEDVLDLYEICLVNMHIYLEMSRGRNNISQYMLLTTNQKFSIIILSTFEVKIVSKIQVIQSKIQEKLVRTDKT